MYWHIKMGPIQWVVNAAISPWLKLSWKLIYEGEMRQFFSGNQSGRKSWWRKSQELSRKLPWKLAQNEAKNRILAVFRLRWFPATCSILYFPIYMGLHALSLKCIFLSVICCSFWTRLGACMTKLNPDETKIHIIGNNVTGNKKGESLLKFLSKAMRPSKVKVESPLELGQAGQWLRDNW